MTVHKERMAQSTEKDFSNATELADYLASKGLPFRQAHEIVGKLVLECSKAGYYLQDIPLERYQEISSIIGTGYIYSFRVSNGSFTKEFAWRNRF